MLYNVVIPIEQVHHWKDLYDRHYSDNSYVIQVGIKKGQSSSNTLECELNSSN